MHTFRIYKYKGRDVIVMEVEPNCWRVRFIEYNTLQHTALVDPREVQPTPYTWRALTPDGRRVGSIPQEG